MKTIGIVAHGAEGAVILGPHMHPTIVVSAVPMTIRKIDARKD